MIQASDHGDRFTEAGEPKEQTMQNLDNLYLAAHERAQRRAEKREADADAWADKLAGDFIAAIESGQWDMQLFTPAWRDRFLPARECFAETLDSGSKKDGLPVAFDKRLHGLFVECLKSNDASLRLQAQSLLLAMANDYAGYHAGEAAAEEA